MISTSLAENVISSTDEYGTFKKEVLNDFYLTVVSREASLTARKEVLTGKAKFGIIGDGKELAQIAMAKYFQKGDWRSGYYRDQTFMFATGLSSIEDFFAQLYADVENDPFSGGRQMNSHYASPLIDSNEEWLDSTQLKNVSADISCTGGQMARALGIALASKQYRTRSISNSEKFSKNGNEISFVTIGDASTSEGVFWETMNAAAVMKVPLITCVWDDGYGISVPKELQTAKASISKALEGLHIDEEGNGIYIFKSKGWDYQDLCRVFKKATEKVRENHIPALIHIEEVTQPQGHSTSGSHERYKSPERLQWEKDFDCIEKFSEWILQNGIADQETLDQIRQEAKTFTLQAKKNAWSAYQTPVFETLKELQIIFDEINHLSGISDQIKSATKALKTIVNPTFSEIVKEARHVEMLCRLSGLNNDRLTQFVSKNLQSGVDRYKTNLYSEGQKAAINIPVVAPEFSDDSKKINGYQVLNTFFDQKLEEDESIIAFGEDVGQIGDVNQGFAGLQEKYSSKRVFDTGIREWTIIGQGLGAAMRGLRPIAEIQYLDYITYAFSALTDDLATVRYRSNGIQQSPLIVRTRGHRLEGIWHAGSPMGVLVNGLRGMHVCVPRNMVQAAGMYNTLLQSNDPALVIECLNGYRLKELMPDNIGQFTVPLGSPEILRPGHHLTMVSYGSCIRPAQAACDMLAEFGIEVELIDVQTLLPFDLEHSIVESIKKTNRLLVVDEDVPGGASAYILRELLETQNAYQYLDSKPVTLTAKEHRTPFGSDGDYFTKPGQEDITNKVYEILEEAGVL